MSWFSIQELEYLLRIVLAAVCGGAIGFERERRSKSAGIRTHIIVALSAALMMVVSKSAFLMSSAWGESLWTPRGWRRGW